MDKQEVHIVSNIELGWDSIMGVYSNEEAAITHKESIGRYGTIHSTVVEQEYLDE